MVVPHRRTRGRLFRHPTSGGFPPLAQGGADAPRRSSAAPTPRRASARVRRGPALGQLLQRGSTYRERPTTARIAFAMRRPGVRIPSAPPTGNPVRPAHTCRPGRGSPIVIHRPPPSVPPLVPPRSRVQPIQPHQVGSGPEEVEVSVRRRDRLPRTTLASVRPSGSWWEALLAKSPWQTSSLCRPVSGTTAVGVSATR